MPLEYCEYSGMTDKCMKWLEANLPSEFEKLGIASTKDLADTEKKHQKRGGKVKSLINVGKRGIDLKEFSCFGVKFTYCSDRLAA